MSQVLNGGPAALGLEAARERLREKAGAILAFGVLLIALGIAALIYTFGATIATVTLNGVFFIVGGGAEVVVGAHARTWPRFFFWILGGALYVVAGLICIFDPLLAANVLTLLLGAGLIAAGVVRAIFAFGLPSDRPRGMILLAATLTFLLGLIIVLHWPLNSVYVLGALLGVDLLFHGAGYVAFGIGLRAQRRT